MSARPTLDANERKAVKERRLVLDCLRMTLVREGTARFTGSGTVKQNERGGLDFTLLDPTYMLEARAIHHFGSGDGTWIDPKDLHNLTAVDLHGREWHTRRVDIDTDHRIGEPGAVVRGTCREIVCRSRPDVPGNARLSCFFPGEIEIVTNARTDITTEVGGRAFTGGSWNILKADTTYGELQVVVDGSGLDTTLVGVGHEFPPGLLQRLEETLSVVLGHPLHWTFASVRSGDSIEMHVREEKPFPTTQRIGAPLRQNEIGADKDVVLMIDRYLKHVLLEPVNGRHHLTVAVIKAMQASALPLDYEYLVLPVEVEGLVRRRFADHGMPDPAFVLWIDEILKAISTFAGPSNFLTRLRNCIGNLKGTNPRGALLKLALDGVIEQAHVKAWTQMRNPATHGEMVDTDEVRDLVANCNRVHQLLLLLIFREIGYDGRFTDYTKDNWPLRESKGASTVSLSVGAEAEANP